MFSGNEIMGCGSKSLLASRAHPASRLVIVGGGSFGLKLNAAEITDTHSFINMFIKCLMQRIITETCLAGLGWVPNELFAVHLLKPQ